MRPRSSTPSNDDFRGAGHRSSSKFVSDVFDRGAIPCSNSVRRRCVYMRRKEARLERTVSDGR